MENETINTNCNSHKLKGLYKFFCWCSGSRLYLLKQCPTDYNVFFGIGLIVFLTGIMAAMSGSYAFYTVFNNVLIAVAFGVFWGILIFAFDWYLVASLKKEERVFKELLTAAPRIILAVFLAVVISRPVELKLFESEINAQIEKLNQQKLNEFNSVVSQSYNELDELKQQNRLYTESLNDLLLNRNQLFELVIEEAEGRSPTSKVGKGLVYREKKAEYDRLAKLYDNERERLLPLIAENNKRIADMSARRQANIDGSSQVILSGTGFLARLDAYNQLSKNNKAIKLTGWFILAMFICIESGPMFVKLISRRGAYDALLEFTESSLISNYEQQVLAMHQKTKRVTEIEKQKTLSIIESEIDDNREFTKIMMEARAEINRSRINRWKENELKKDFDDLNKYTISLDELIARARGYITNMQIE